MGQILGLRRATLLKYNQQLLAGELIECWLRRDYRVLEESGEPTWHSLATALNKIGLNGVSQDIVKAEQVGQPGLAEKISKNCQQEGSKGQSP